MIVPLRCAPLPFIGAIALHCWFVVIEAGEARALRAVLQDAASYPCCSRYLVWPGPNSNTFVAWVLEQAGIACRLGWRGIGKGRRLKRS